jgi:TetR/AcrR family transcriptional regulator, mexJK operon transcriptional repressor
VLRSRAAAVNAARELFMKHCYAGTTMEEIAARAGLTKRTLYNNYADKDALFTEVVAEIIAYAEAFARGLAAELAVGMTAAKLRPTLRELGQRMAFAIVRPEVIALRRLLIGEARVFPALARDYYDRAPGQVIDALAAEFARLRRARLLRVRNARRAAAQFAYLVAGEHLDRAVLIGTPPPREQLIASAREGVETFLARYAPAPAQGGRRGSTLSAR